MIVAQKKQNHHEYLSQQELNSTRVKKINKKQRRKVKIICSILAFFAFGLCFTTGSAIQAMKINQINQLEKEIEDLKIANERLLYKTSQLQSLERIENIAISELGMQKPEIENLEMLSGEQANKLQSILFAQNELEKEPEENEEVEREDKFSELNPYVAAISSLISSWLISK